MKFSDLGDKGAQLKITVEAAPAGVKLAAGAAMGALSGAGGHILGAVFGPIGSVAMAAAMAHQGATLGMKMADGIWDFFSDKLGGDDNAEEFAMAHLNAANKGLPTFDYRGKTYNVKVPQNQARAAAIEVRKVTESLTERRQQGSLNEFAPGGGDGDDGEEDTLLKFARMWYNGDEATQQRVEQALARQGWEIGELESEEGGAFVVQSGDENGDTYIGFAVTDLTEGWKDKLAAAALAGTMALGAAGAQARVSPGDDPSINRLNGKPVATQVAPAASQAVQPGASLPGKNLQAVDNIEGNKANGYTITQDGNSYDVKVVPKGSPTPRGGKMMKVTQAQVGERGIGNYVVYLLNNGTAYLYMGDVSESRDGEDFEPELAALKKEFDKFANSDRANRDVADSDIDDEDVANDMGQDIGDDLDEATLAQMRDYFNQPDDSMKVNRAPGTPGKPAAGIPHEIQALVNKMYHSGKVTPQEFEILRKFQQKTKINVGLKEADKNPYAIGMAQAMKSTGDKPPLKKSTINKAHEIARAVKKGE